MTEPSHGPVVAIVVAAGSGSRLGGETPKALRCVAGRPLVLHAVEHLAQGGVDVALVMVGEGLEDVFAEALTDASIPCGMLPGGAERQHSVANGVGMLSLHGLLEDTQIVLVHDAARAFVPPDVVRRVIEAVANGAEAVAPVMPVVDTVRQMTSEGHQLLDRASLRIVQTPQGFQRDVIEKAHGAVEAAAILVTDDVAAAELAGFSVTLVEGSSEAMKITRPFDLLVAEAMLSQTRKEA